MASDEIRIPIATDGDIVLARQQGRELAATLGFSASDLTLIVTAISEVARNVVVYAERGEIVISRLEERGRQGILVIAQDHGPGIPDIEQAMRDGFSTGKSLGLGLPGAKRLMDEFDIASEIGKGTMVTMRKWAP